MLKTPIFHFAMWKYFFNCPCLYDEFMMEIGKTTKTNAKIQYDDLMKSMYTPEGSAYTSTPDRSMTFSVSSESSSPLTSESSSSLSPLTTCNVFHPNGNLLLRRVQMMFQKVQMIFTKVQMFQQVQL